MTELPSTLVSLSIRQTCEATGASASMIRRMLHTGELRGKRVNGRVFVDPASVREVFGFDEERQQECRAAQRIEDIAARILGSSR